VAKSLAGKFVSERLGWNGPAASKEPAFRVRVRVSCIFLFRLSASETECPADHRKLATGIAPVRSNSIEREARGSSECRGDETRSSPSTDLRGGRFGWLLVSYAAIAAQESAPSSESPRLLWFSGENR